VNDDFAEIARFYDPLMVHVDYDRWYAVSDALATLLPDDFVHVDLACGTGKLHRKLRRGGWKSFGMDLSLGMVRTGRKEDPSARLAAADLRALPLKGCVDFVTCLFDSVNFLLTLEDVEIAFREVYGALKDDGLFYFDVVTEKMVIDHFAGQKWTEKNHGFCSTWDTRYSRKTLTAETRIQINQGPVCTIRERVYSTRDLRAALERAGFVVLGAWDAEKWKAPGRKTVRIDWVAAKGRFGKRTKAFQRVVDAIRDGLV